MSASQHTYSTMFTRYILPISGTDFVRYMAFYSILADFSIRPSQIYCASGGCLASYMAMMSSFTKQIEEWNLSSDMVMEKTTPFKMRLVTYITSGYLYRRPDMYEYLTKSFVPAKMRDAEIISGYYKTEEKKVVITTNMTSTQSSIGTEQRERLNSWHVDFSYAPENINELMAHTCNTIRRTSNIPYLLESDDRGSVDFGVIAPSPVILLNIDPNRSIYFSPIDLECDKSSSLAHSIFYRMIMNEVISIENRFTSKQKFRQITEALQLAYNKSRYALIIFTTADIRIPIDNFNSRMIRESINQTKASINFYVFYDQ